MAKLNYGVLKGTITGHLRDADDDHYQILVTAANTMFRIAVNVHSSLSPPDLLFQTITSLPDSLRQQLTASYKSLDSCSDPAELRFFFLSGEAAHFRYLENNDRHLAPILSDGRQNGFIQRGGAR